MSDFGLWTVQQDLSGSPKQMDLFKNVTGNLENNAFSLTFFVCSVGKLVGLENKSLAVIYITFVYGFFKIFRSIFVEPATRIPIRECKDPAYILMLIETI